MLQGRFAGHKAVVVKSFDKGTKERPYPHLIVAGIDRAPLKVTRAMSKRVVAKRTRVKPFVKVINVTHVMPTRFTMKMDLRGVVNQKSIAPSHRHFTRRAVRKQFEMRHRDGKSQWFFSKLKF